MPNMKIGTTFESQIRCAILENLDDPEVCLKKYLKDMNQTYAIAKVIVGLKKGNSKDPMHCQRCPIVGCTDVAKSFRFTAKKNGDHVFFCSICNREYDIFELIKNTDNAISANWKKTKLERAIEWLKTHFKKCRGRIMYKNVKANLKVLNKTSLPKDRISMSTLRSARKALGADLKPVGFGKDRVMCWVLLNWQQVCK